MAASREDLRTMQETLLRGVLLGEPLGSSSIRLVMPDLQFVIAGGSIRLLGENLYGQLSIPNSPKPLQVVDRADLLSGFNTAKDGAYLRFAPSVIEDNVVHMKLEARLSPDPSGTELGLSSVQVDFTCLGDQWIAGAPTFSAS